MKHFLQTTKLVFTLLTLVSISDVIAQEPILCDSETCDIKGFGTEMRAIWIPGLPGPSSIEYNSTETSLTMDKFDNGTAHIYGDVYNQSNSDYGWYVDFWIEGKSDWIEWSALGRYWKGETEIVQDLYEGWDYYIVDESKTNQLIGTGLYEGSNLDLTHKPGNYYYGFQMGQAANDQNDAYGFSCWFFYSGEVLGQEVSGACDINGEGTCSQQPVMECIADVALGCGEELTFTNTGLPEISCPDYILTYSDTYTSDCPVTISREWKATNSAGEEIVCIQEITSPDLTAPEITDDLEDLIVSEFPTIDTSILTAIDNCSEATIETTITELSAGDAECGQFRTQTPGGWGAPASGDNPGTYRDANFDIAFPDGLEIGCGHKLYLSSASAVENFLPSGSTPAVLTQSLINPVEYGNTLAGHLVAITLSLKFDQEFGDFGESNQLLKDQIIGSGTFAGWSVEEVVSMANQILGDCSDEYSASAMVEALSLVNENYVDGVQNNGNLNCPNATEDCAETFIVTYTTTDECGNSSSVNQIIYVQSAESYTAVNCPEDVTVECDQIPDAPEVIFNADCGSTEPGILSEEIVQGECEGNYTIIRTWVVTNGMGETAECTQQVTVVDNTPPVFINAPEDITVECGNIPEPEIQAEDNCALQSVEIQLVEAQLSGNCYPTIQRTFMAEDNCGNVASHTQYITVVDTQAPEITNEPEDIVLNCGDEVPVYQPIPLDNCSAQLTVTYSENHSTLDCGSQLEQVWIVTDNCNNSAQVNRIIVFEDNAPPVLDGDLNDTTAECFEALTEPNFYDDCGGDVVVTSTPSSLSGCGTTMEVVFTVSDNCGNTSEFTQNVTVVDTEAPVLTLEQASIEVLCEDAEDLNPPLVEDCNEVVLTSSDVFSDLNEGCASINRTWFAEDACGNVSSIQQEIILLDEEAPVFLNNPLNINTTCSNFITPDLPAVTDNCDEDVEIELTITETTIECGVEITHTWTATDNCGNTAQIDQVVTVTDEEAPLISGESVISAECGESIDNLVTVEDDCAAFIELTYTDEVSSENSCQSILTRTYTAADPCGNTAEFVQQITFVDTQSPEISPTPEVNLQCVEELATVELATAVDNCSDAEITFMDDVIEVECTTTINRMYTATDACGNAATQTQVITITDDESPEFITTLTDINLECGESAPVPAEVQATDNCSEVTVTYSEELIPNNCEAAVITVRTWTATDACGNSAELTQVVSIEDNEAPVFDNELEDIIGECGMEYPVPSVTATDDCSQEVQILFNQTSEAGGCPNIIRTWTAIDACGNSNSMIQVIYIEDTEPPLMSGIEYNITATCDNIPDVPVPTVSDNCDNNVDVTVTESLTGTGCEQILIRMWIATDDCGNTTIATQSINLIDQAPPVFINPIADNAVECDDLNALALPEVQDDCGGEVNLTFTDEELGDGCESQIIRTYTAFDLCGNSASFTQTITVIDLSSPLFIGIPPGTFVDCNDIPDPITPTVIDNCNNDGLVVEFSEEIQGEGCSYVILRQWTATDICGNTSNASRYIFVQDVSAPVFMGAPEDVVLNCNSEIPESAMVAAVDGCSGQVDVMFSQEQVVDDCGTIVTRTWSATDDCGNTATLTQLIEITDLEAPELSGVPQNVNATCTSLPPVIDVSATDNCVADPQVNYREEIISGECPYQIHRIWTAIDNCGNEAEATQIIFVTDDEAPLFLEAPEDLTMTCGELEEAQLLIATDGCTSEPVVTITEEYNGTDCNLVLIRTWTATDHCGNIAEVSQSITLMDTEPPAVMPYESEFSVECTDRPEFVAPEFIDDCNELIITATEQKIDGECANTYDWIKTWTATDFCGNSVEATQTIHVIDSSAPILSAEELEITVTCDEIPDLEPLAVFGECGDYDIEFTEEVVILEELDSECTLGNASSLLGDVAIWLPNLSSDGADFVFGNEPGTFTRDHATGDITITGQVYNVNNPSQSWILDLKLYDSQNWAQWSANGGNYKDDLGLAGDNYLDWEYLKLSGESTLTGAGEYAGAELNLSHTPGDFSYGFQIGQGANNRNGNFGISGWFFYEGMLDGNFVFGTGDLIADVKCCPDQDIIREWTVVDCSGNSTTVTQIIHVRAALQLSPMTLYELPEEAKFDVTNSTGEEFVLTFDSGEDQTKILIITDLSGRTLHSETFSGLEKNTEYTKKISKNEYLTGVYVFRLNGKTESSSDKEVKLK